MPGHWGRTCCCCPLPPRTSWPADRPALYCELLPCGSSSLLFTTGIKPALCHNTGRLKPNPLWRAEIRERSLVLRLPHRYRVLGWAPLNGGVKRAEVIINHQIDANDRSTNCPPRRYLSAVVRSMGFDPRHTVAMMTGVPMRRAAAVSLWHGDLIVSAWCTAGCSNALRVGDRATVDGPQMGTINLIVAINQSLTESALIEAIQIATEARAAALSAARVRSTRSRRIATGTGTDCIVVAAPEAPPIQGYCGKHTRLGELIGRAALRACAQALARWRRSERR